MQRSDGFVTILLLLFSALLVTGASLPKPSSIISETSLQIVDSNASANAAFAVATSVPFPYRNILFNFTLFGDPIPKREVEKVFTGADQAITDLVDEHPFSPIANNRFEYRAPGGNTLISIKAFLGRAITWSQLFRILQGLYRFMLGLGAGQHHCQVLEFEIAFAGQSKVGLGLVWHFPNGIDEFRKRKILPISTSASNQTLLQLPNAVSPILGSVPHEELILFHIPHTSLALSFFNLGIPIPQENVRSALQEAMANVRPFLNGWIQYQPIENGTFDWPLNPSDDRGRTGVTVFAYVGHVVTWRDLFDVLYGLYAFATTFGTDLPDPHYQILGFRIRNQKEATIGIGTLSYYPPRAVEVEKRTKSVNQSLLQSPNITGPSLSSVAAGTSILWPVRDTVVVLNFTYLGENVPKIRMIETLNGAQLEIANHVRTRPDTPISDDRFHYSPYGTHVRINILTYRAGSISWLELSQIIFGITQFCADQHDQVLVFEIDIGEQSVGFGTLLYFVPKAGPSSELEKRSLNTTLTLPSLAVSSKSIHYTIPGTADSLLFTSFGQAIPPSQARNAISWNLNDISAFVQAIPHSAVPANRYKHHDDSGISIIISASAIRTMTWAQLDEILTGLGCFMTGISPLSGQDPETHYQALKFTVNMKGMGYLGHGVVGYSPPASDGVEKRATIDNETVLQLIGETDSSTESVKYPVLNSPATLSFTYFGRKIPAGRINQALIGALNKIDLLSEMLPTNPISDNRFRHIETFDSVGEAVVVNIYGSPESTTPVTWLLLYRVLIALQSFMNGSGPRSLGNQKHFQILEFVIKGRFDVELGNGLVWYLPGKSERNKRTVAIESHLRLPNAAVSSASNAITVKANIPFPVPNTPVTLILTPLPATIPTNPTLTMLFKARSQVSTFAARRPNSRIPRNWFEYNFEANQRGDTASVFVHGYAEQIITWSNVDDVFKGLIDVIVSGTGQYNPGLRFEVDVAGHGEIGLGKVWYTPGERTITERATTTGHTPVVDGDEVQQLNGTIASPAATVAPEDILQKSYSTPPRPGNSSSPDILQPHLPFPIINSSITLIFTDFGMHPIPLGTVGEFFLAVSKSIEPYVTRTPNRPISPHLWHYEFQTPRTRDELSISIYTHPTYTLSWLQLSKILQGLEIFMTSQMSTLGFDIDIDGDGPTAKGVIWYTPSKRLGPSEESKAFA